MNSLTRQLSRVAIRARPSTATLNPCSSTLAGPSTTKSRPRVPAAAPCTAATCSRTYATESSHLGNLSPAPGSTHKRKRIGRGIGSGRGGTSGRGHKGSGARSGNGKPKLHFAGGQTPLTRAFPKRGFNNPLGDRMTPLNLDKLQHWIDQGLIDPTEPITMRELYQTRCVHGIKDGVKLLGDGAEHWRTPNVHITVSRASQSAIRAIEALNGTLVARYENRLTLRALTRPESIWRKGLPLPNKADPVSRRDLLFYSNAQRNRGYLGLQKLAETDAEVQRAATEALAAESAEQANEPQV
ncbi:YmL10 [Microbotryomycetes sp. JL201]|nr:YmL10 [Microbotryomycetes sp. JL201]